VAGRLNSRAGALLLISLVAEACGGFLPTPIGPPTDPPFGTSIDVANGTTLTVEIWVNGSPVGSAPPGSASRILPGDLPAQPWRVDARTINGRVLLQFEVQPGQVTRTSDGGVTTMSGAGSRADLSCGRLDVTVGPPMLGPPPGPGSPGDCEP
jgi:hypothetical protein